MLSSSIHWNLALLGVYLGVWRVIYPQPNHRMPQMATITDVVLRKAKAQEKPFKIAAGNGLYMLVSPIGSKLWRWKYRIAGKEKLLALGPCPAVSLQDARQRCEKARRLLALGHAA